MARGSVSAAISAMTASTILIEELVNFSRAGSRGALQRALNRPHRQQPDNECERTNDAALRHRIQITIHSPRVPVPFSLLKLRRRLLARRRQLVNVPVDALIAHLRMFS